MSAKKVPVTLTYTSPGAQPPIFLAGSFSEPEWHPQEMEFTTAEDGQHIFHKEILADKGCNFQYKFRIGTGDWWALNEQAPIATDDLGNRNNLLSVPKADMDPPKSSPSGPSASTTAPDIPIPEVVVEKVDEYPRHGDDFGPNATTEQKCAHEKRAQDPEADHVEIRSQTNTPVYASTAAEVADSAALLDREPSPAPISDEEAGRIGQRRMSGTPIPQVALTAAEVADIAAILDKDHAMSISPSISRIDFPLDDLSGYPTPGLEAAPLFAHECVGSEDIQGVFPVEPPSVQPNAFDSIPGEAKDVDMNDPSIEEFPSDRLSILAHVRSAESRLSEDETSFDGIPASPIVRYDSRSPSVGAPNSTHLDAQPSPLLGAISEEKQGSENYFDGLPSPNEKVAERNGSQDAGALNPIEEADEAGALKAPDEPKAPSGVLDDLKKIEQTHKETARTDSLAEPEIKTVEKAREGEKPAEDVPLQIIEEAGEHVQELSKREPVVENQHNELVGNTAQPDADSVESQRPDHSEGRQETYKPRNIGEHQSVDNLPQPTVSNDNSTTGLVVKDLPPGTTVQVKEADVASDLQESSPEHIFFGLTPALATIATNGPHTTEESSLNRPVMSHVAIDEIPRVNVMSATEIKQPDDALANSMEVAKPMAIDDLPTTGNGDSQLKLRNPLQSERPITPSSFTPPSIKGKESTNFLKTIWRTVFVGWIGGLIAHLCGGERGPLLATSAILVLTVASAVYISKMS